uniref:DC-UbP/UBTD2 N-terminal domain-containing protein n=1 Tax=Ficedula albicollis TaxID=59894 RepID=U3K2G2_FICAL
MTDGQLRSKRDEFWDTAPAFEGRKEIWDALKAAAHAFESNDHELAQAIIDGANITLPHVPSAGMGELVLGNPQFEPDLYRQHLGFSEISWNTWMLQGTIFIIFFFSPVSLCKEVDYFSLLILWVSLALELLGFFFFKLSLLKSLKKIPKNLELAMCCEINCKLLFWVLSPLFCFSESCWVGFFFFQAIFPSLHNSGINNFLIFLIEIK